MNREQGADWNTGAKRCTRFTGSSTFAPLSALVAPLLAFTALGTACGGAQSPSCDLPGRVSLTVKGSNALNPDREGKPLPTLVRIYQLSDPGKAKRASFDALWQDGAAALGDTSLSEDELTLFPKDRVEREFTRDPKASYLLAVAIFREPQKGRWKKLLRLPPTLGEQNCAAAAQGIEGPDAAGNAKVLIKADKYALSGSVRIDSSGLAKSAAKDAASAGADAGAGAAKGAALK